MVDATTSSSTFPTVSTAPVPSVVPVFATLPNIVAATLYASLQIIRAVVKNADGTTTEQDWHVMADGLPAIELPYGQAVRSFTAAGGVIAEASGIPPVANFDQAEVPVTPASSASTPVAVAIPDINLRQFCVQLALDGKITQNEALAWIQGQALPAAVIVAITQLPKVQQFPAKALLFGAQTFQRSSPLAATLGALLGMDDAALNTLWTSAALQ